MLNSDIFFLGLIARIGRFDFKFLIFNFLTRSKKTSYGCKGFWSIISFYFRYSSPLLLSLAHANKYHANPFQAHVACQPRGLKTIAVKSYIFSLSFSLSQVTQVPSMVFVSFKHSFFSLLFSPPSFGIPNERVCGVVIIFIYLNHLYPTSELKFIT